MPITPRNREKWAPREGLQECFTSVLHVEITDSLHHETPPPLSWFCYITLHVVSCAGI